MTTKKECPRCQSNSVYEVTSPKKDAGKDYCEKCGLVW